VNRSPTRRDFGVQEPQFAAMLSIAKQLLSLFVVQAYTARKSLYCKVDKAPLPTQRVIRMLIQKKSFIHIFIHSFIHSFVRSFVRSFMFFQREDDDNSTRLRAIGLMRPCMHQNARIWGKFFFFLLQTHPSQPPHSHCLVTACVTSF